MYKSKLVEGLEELYKPLGNEWVNNNAFILNTARRCELAIGGSIGMAIGRKCARKIPGDIDLFNDDYSKSLAFLSEVVEFLSNKIESVGYKIQFNNNTKFTLPGVSHHIRITVPFWKPVCIMTLKRSLRAYFFKGLMVQDYTDIKSAAETIEKIDGKPRIPESLNSRMLRVAGDHPQENLGQWSGGVTPIPHSHEIAGLRPGNRTIAFQFVQQERDVNGNNVLS